jgi:very-short-patch-repair endonuclease
LTPFEASPWRQISRSQIGGFKFRRQHVIGNCIVDFFCPQKGLIVEVEVDTHDPKKDLVRDRMNEHRGYHTIRFTNGDVGKNLEGVLIHLYERLTALRDRWPHPSPSPEGERK